MHSPLISAQEVAARLGVSVYTVYRLKDKPDGLKAYRVGRSIRFRPGDVDDYLAAQQVKPVQPNEHFGEGIKRFRYVPGMKVVG